MKTRDMPGEPFMGDGRFIEDWVRFPYSSYMIERRGSLCRLGGSALLLLHDIDADDVPGAMPRRCGDPNMMFEDMTGLSDGVFLVESRKISSIAFIRT